VSTSCETEVVELLREVRRHTGGSAADDAAFDAAQSAQVAAGAEHYYRAMVRGDRMSWNVCEHHMADNIDRLAGYLGPESKGPVWEHNAHVGDARATDMASAGLVKVGPLVRERHAAEGWRWWVSPRTTARRRGHRAIGVVYEPRAERGNHVPTVMGGRYDALL
jgi:erythromycin esterase-like protein